MVKTLSSVGNSLALIIERPILDLLNITKDTPLEITTDGTSLTLRPIRPSHEERVRASTERMLAAHHDTLRDLAK